MVLTDELLEKLGNFYTHEAARIIYPHLADMTFEQFITKYMTGGFIYE